MLAIIVGCEVAFWFVVALGLLLRYPLRQRRLGGIVLGSVILVDVVLLAAVAIHLLTGGTAELSHAIAAFYLGFSIAYGHRLVRWADVRFAHRYAGGPAPVKLAGWAYTRQCWGDVRRTALACAIAIVVSVALILLVRDAERTAWLQQCWRWSAFLVGLELFWAVGYSIWPRGGADAGTPQPEAAAAPRPQPVPARQAR